jgi:hypothetical protein
VDVITVNAKKFQIANSKITLIIGATPIGVAPLLMSEKCGDLQRVISLYARKKKALANID